jgi:hypothetical protein
MAVKSTFFALFFTLQAAFSSAQVTYNADSTLLPLARSITQNAQNDSDKVVAIYQWMCKNLTYDYRSDDNVRGGDSFQRPAVVVQRKKAVCDGYAQLFRDLCLLNNVYASYIVGYTSFNDLTDSAQTLHAWNGVRVNARWYLMDITWEDANMDFVKDPTKPNRLSPRERLQRRLAQRQSHRLVDNLKIAYKDVEKVGLGNFLDFMDSTTAIAPELFLGQSHPSPVFSPPAKNYFFTPPHVFRTDHLPKDPLWQLSDSVVSLQKFFFQQDPSVSPYFSTHFDYKKRLEELPFLDSLECQHRELSRELQFNPRDWIVIQNVAFDYNSRIHRTFQEFNAQSDTATVIELEQMLIAADLNLVQAEGFHRMAGKISTGYSRVNMIENLAVCTGYRQHIEQLREWIRANRRE